jgi:hypothetical protein
MRVSNNLETQNSNARVITGLNLPGGVRILLQYVVGAHRLAPPSKFLRRCYDSGFTSVWRPCV